MDFCLFCENDVSHFARHLSTQHNSEPEVVQIFSFESGSKERHNGLLNLKKRGNFIKNENDTTLRPVKRVKHGSDVEGVDFVSCSYCLGVYKKTVLYQHTKVCSESQKDKICNNFLSVNKQENMIQNTKEAEQCSSRLSSRNTENNLVGMQISKYDYKDVSF